MHRFYVPAGVTAAELWLLDQEAAHLTQVLRHAVGDRVELFDGQGNHVVGELTELQKRKVRLRVVALLPSDPLPVQPLTLAVAPPKGERLEWLVEKATELGVEELVLLQTQRTVAEPGGGKIEKLRAGVVTACKQSGRNRLMTISPMIPWPVFCASQARTSQRWFATPQGQPIREALRASSSAEPHPAPAGDQTSARDELGTAVPVGWTVAVGPEGGWTDEEQQLALKSGFVAVSLGERILRIETAALAAASWIGLQCRG